MTDGVVSLLAGFISYYSITGEVVRPQQALLNGGVPYFTCYKSSDGKYVSIGCIEPWFWAELCRALGREDLISHQNVEGDKKQWLFSELQRIFLTKTRDEWFDLLSQSDICVGKVYSLDELDSDPPVAPPQDAGGDRPAQGGQGEAGRGCAQAVGHTGRDTVSGTAARPAHR